MKVLLIILFCLLTLELSAQFRDEAVWVNQNSKTANFRFELLIWHDQSSPQQGTVYAVKVINRQTGATVQLDSVMSNLGNDSLSDIVRIQDCNFDGCPDFYFFNDRGNVNSTYNFFLYDTGMICSAIMRPCLP